jgi:hypothetical protein
LSTDRLYGVWHNDDLNDLMGNTIADIWSWDLSAYRWFANANSADVGAPLEAQDTAATLENSGDAFRLRILLHNVGQTPLNGENLKLQFAEKSGTCDTAFAGETYADVTGVTDIAFSTANTPSDGDSLVANANDPTHGGHTIVNQDYEEANNFTNSVAVIPSGQDGKWDFSLIDNGAPGGTTYCFRVVESGGDVIDTYSVIPEMTVFDDGGGGAQTLTFSLSDNTIGFGTISSGEGRYATGSGSGTNLDVVDAHTISAATNASSGYTITVQGTTLTCASCGDTTITAIGDVAVESAPGTEQFGIRLIKNSGTGTAIAPYNGAMWAFDTLHFPDVVATGDGDGSTSEYGVRYIGNIAADTEAGDYSAVLTYTVTATF